MCGVNGCTIKDTYMHVNAQVYVHVVGMHVHVCVPMFVCVDVHTYTLVSYVV